MQSAALLPSTAGCRRRLSIFDLPETTIDDSCSCSRVQRMYRHSVYQTIVDARGSNTARAAGLTKCASPLSASERVPASALRLALPLGPVLSPLPVDLPLIAARHPCQGGSRNTKTATQHFLNNTRMEVSWASFSTHHAHLSPELSAWPLSSCACTRRRPGGTGPGGTARAVMKRDTKVQRRVYGIVVHDLPSISLCEAPMHKP
jgi:hypothetical protein